MSNFASLPLDQQGADGYGVTAPLVAEIVGIKKETTGYNLVMLRDFTGEDKQVLINGRAKPGVANIGQIAVFALSATTKGKYINYAGFYNPTEAIPAQFAGKRPPVPNGGGGSATRGAGTGGGCKSGGGGCEGKNRGFALSYAKDLVVAGAIQMADIASTTKTFDLYLTTGRFTPKAAPVQQPQQQQPVRQPVEQEIAEQGEAQYGGNQTNQAAAKPAAETQVSEFEQQYAIPVEEEDMPF